MFLVRFFKRLLSGPKTWEKLSDQERQEIVKLNASQKRKKPSKSNSTRTDIGPMIAGEGSYTNTEKREQFVGNRATPMARALAEERAEIIREAGRERD
ncbi:MAG: hypothetical protein EBT26_05520 [Microbacteriaceae bacterium]|nr:hypothetical protein [Microbacteriaceae bacterium]NBS61485.1 hypothetical protein [Microbacteriaceae bacterium]